MAKGTVVVNLKKNWFSPDSSLYEVRTNPHEFPAAWAEPPERKEDESKEDFKARLKIQPYAVLPSTAKIVEDAKIVEVYQDTASGAVVTQTAVEGDVKTVGNTVDDKSKGPDDHNKAHQSTSVDKAAAAVEPGELGGRPRESGPLPPSKK